MLPASSESKLKMTGTTEAAQLQPVLLRDIAPHGASAEGKAAVLSALGSGVVLLRFLSSPAMSV